MEYITVTEWPHENIPTAAVETFQSAINGRKFATPTGSVLADIFIEAKERQKMAPNAAAQDLSDHIDQSIIDGYLKY